LTAVTAVSICGLISRLAARSALTKEMVADDGARIGAARFTRAGIRITSVSQTQIAITKPGAGDNVRMLITIATANQKAQ
jgi:hypothetical protein